MQTWVIYGPEGPRAEPLHDPNQRIRPRLAGPGPDVDWHLDDGQDMAFPAVGSGLAIDGHTFAPRPGAEGASVYVTDRRVLLVLPDVDPATVPDGGGDAGSPETLRLACQVDFLCLSELRSAPAADGTGRETLSFASRTGAADPPAARVVSVTADAVEVDMIVQSVWARARSAQFRASLRPLTEEGRQALLEASFRGEDGAQVARFGAAALSLAEIAGIAGITGRPARPPA